MDGTFQNPVTYSSGGYEAVSVAVGDVNGDGIPDIVVANECLKPKGYYGEELCEGDGIVGVFIGNGDGTLQPAVTYDSGGVGAGSVTLADLNGDGILDLVVANECASKRACDYNGQNEGVVSVLLGNGNGTFQEAVDYGTGGFYAFGAVVADLRGDGIFDVVAVNECENSINCDVGSIGVLLGNGDGTFQAASVYIPAGQVGPWVAIGDVNGDGIPDLVTITEFDSPCDSASCLEVMLGNGDGTFQAPMSSYLGGSGGTSPVLADVNGDGILDLVTGMCVEVFCYSPEASIGVLFGNGDGTFQAPISFEILERGPTQSIAVADVNNDGKPDVLAANYGNQIEQLDGSASVLLNNSGAPTITVSLVPNENPIPLNQQVTYTATVSSQTGGMLAGTVTFMDWTYIYLNSAVVPLQNNEATFSTEYNNQYDLPHWIAAFYSGVLDQEASGASSTLSEYVCGVPVEHLATSHSPSKLGHRVTFTARIGARGYKYPPNGEPVTFYDGSTELGSVPLTDGKAVFATSGLSEGTHVIEANYSGDEVICQSSAQITQVVEQ